MKAGHETTHASIGNKHLISALTRIKSYLDYGAFTPVQVAAAAALNGPQDCIEVIRNTYKNGNLLFHKDSN